MESKTTIIATIGPASCGKEVLTELIKHHMDMARLNFSWSKYDEYREWIKLIREISQKYGKDIPIIQDLSGPRVQVGKEHCFGGKEGEEVITPKDIEDLAFGIEQNIEYVALSFVGSKNDIIKLKQIIKEKGGNQKVIAKIERKIAVENLDEILEETDGIMVARGDLGNEFPLEEIPFIQHEIIEESRKAGKFVIVATQMLLSMVNNPIPTRAEVSDVAYAVLDGANGIMLSEESAIGKYPAEAVYMMEKISLVAEKHQKIIKIGE